MTNICKLGWISNTIQANFWNHRDKSINSFLQSFVSNPLSKHCPTAPSSSKMPLNIPALFAIKMRSNLSCSYLGCPVYIPFFLWIFYYFRFIPIMRVYGDGFKRHFQQYFSYIVAVSFINRGNRSTRKKSRCIPSEKVYIVL